MIKCPICQKEFKSRAGLAGHTQFKHSYISEKQLPAASGKQLQVALTGMMLAGKSASMNLWGWRQDMPMVNFIDTSVFKFFEEHGVILNEDGSWYQVSSNIN